MQEFSPPRLTILLISAMALAYEILLMRLFSIVQYHHFAYMIISLALLGYGASGTFLFFTRNYLLRRFPAAVIINIILFGITAVACFLGGQRLLINPDEILWDPRQWLKLGILYLLLALPFFFAANCIALSFSQFRRTISQIYAADLVGAGLGSILIIGLLFILQPQQLLLVLGFMIVSISGVAWYELGLQPRRLALLFLGAGAVIFLLPPAWTGLAISPYKGLSQQLRINGSRIVEVKSSPLALLTLVENQTIPLRFAPGLSLTAESEPPEQLGLFTDADGMDVITRFPDDIFRLAYLARLTTALPYHLQQQKDVLILGAGGGTGILQALYFGVPNITAVELNRQVPQMVMNRPEFAGVLFQRPEVELHIEEARSFVAGSSKKFDLIKLPMLESFSSSAAGLYALHENYLYTVEALGEYYASLSSSGYVSLSRWIKLPPRDTLKLFATAIKTLREAGVPDPERYLVMIRSWQAATLLVKKSPFGPAEIRALKEFCRQQLFDLVYYPGMQREEANRFNILRRPYLHEAAVAIAGENYASFLKNYKFKIEPSTDDRPYFSNFFRWRTLPEILELKGQGGMALLEAGYLILVLTLLQAIAASLVLIVLPVTGGKQHTTTPETDWNRTGIIVYFFAIGLGFLFLEIAFIQKFILYLGHPLYAAATVLALFLVFAGLGSRYVQKRIIRVTWPVAMIISLGVIDLLVFSFMRDTVYGLPEYSKMIIAVLMIGPLAFFMGMPFPLALTSVGKDFPGYISWAWATNGCASVIAAVLATLIAVHLGFAAVVSAALVLYGIGAAFYPAGQNQRDDS